MQTEIQKVGSKASTLETLMASWMVLVYSMG